MNNRRAKGIIASCDGDPRDISSWKVEVYDNALSLNKVLPIASTHNDIALAIGLPVDFIVVNLKTGVSCTEKALDVTPIDISLLPILKNNEDEEDKNQLKKETAQATLWSLVSEISPDFIQKLNEDTLPGAGGIKHKYLQQIIKRAAEDNGFMATLEKVLPGGGRVDVSLKKDRLTIACEVVISNLDGEVANIQKCLDAEPEYTHVISVYENKKSLLSVKKRVRSILQPIELDKVHFFMVEDFIQFISEVAKSTTDISVEKIKGYKVTVIYPPTPTTEDGRSKQEQIYNKLHEIVATSILNNRRKQLTQSVIK